MLLVGISSFSKKIFHSNLFIFTSQKNKGLERFANILEKYDFMSNLTLIALIAWLTKKNSEIISNPILGEKKKS